MALYAFLTWDGAGNQGPTIGLAQAFLARGHDVVFAGYETQRARFEERGFRFRVLERSNAALQAALASAPMPAALARGIWSCPEHADDTRALLAQEGCDGVIADCMMLGALAALDPSRTTVLVHSAPGALAPPRGPLDELLGTTVWDVWSRFPCVCTSIRELDPLATQAPWAFHYVGPLFERELPSRFRPPWPRGDQRPLILVSFTTGTAWNQRSRIERTLAALAESPYRVLVTSTRTDVSGIHVPGNAAVVDYVPHSDVMPFVSVTVTHAGHGTVAMALSHGVPIVALPNPVADQPALAAQVARLGAGLALEGESAEPVAIAKAIATILNEPSYHLAARRLADVIRSASSLTRVFARLGL
jgi:UDP:flavonoid glycosyltransferase YjiC (YdhE family)